MSAIDPTAPAPVMAAGRQSRSAEARSPARARLAGSGRCGRRASSALRRPGCPGTPSPQAPLFHAAGPHPAGPLMSGRGAFLGPARPPGRRRPFCRPACTGYRVRMQAHIDSPNDTPGTLTRSRSSLPTQARKSVAASASRSPNASRRSSAVSCARRRRRAGSRRERAVRRSCPKRTTSPWFPSSARERGLREGPAPCAAPGRRLRA